MIKFNTTYQQHLDSIDEGAFKSLATAGLLASTGLDTSAMGQTETPTHTVMRAPDSVIINSIIDFTKMAEESGRYKSRAYKCPEGKWTIGYGTNIEERHNAKNLERLGYNVKRLIRGEERITKEDADRLLYWGLEQAISDARQFLPNFDEQPLRVKSILTDMAYNLGINRLNSFRNFKESLINKDYSRAKTEMINSLWFRQVGNRSRRLVKMMDDVIKIEG